MKARPLPMKSALSVPIAPRLRALGTFLLIVAAVLPGCARGRAPASRTHVAPAYFLAESENLLHLAADRGEPQGVEGRAQDTSGGEPSTPSSTEVEPGAPGPDLAAGAPGEIDLEEVDVSDISRFEFHGRADVAYVHFGDSDNVDGFRENQVLPISPGIYGRYRLLDWMFVVGEVEYDGLEESVEVDQAVIEMDLVDEYLTLRLGRYYFPFGLERTYYSPSRNTLVDRPAAFRRIYPGTYSDNGIFFEGEYTHHTLWKFGYEAAVSQGLQGFDHEDTPETLEDNNDTPQVGGRLYFQPRPELTFGASYAIGYWDDQDDEILDFFGVDGSLRLFEMEIRAEYVGGRVNGTEEFGSFFRQGWYVHVEKDFEFDLPYLHSIVPVFRVDWIDSNDKEKSFLDVTRYSPGLVFFFLENLQLKTQFSFSDERGGNELSNNGFLTQLVYSW